MATNAAAAALYLIATPFCPAGHAQSECDSIWAAAQAVAHEHDFRSEDRAGAVRVLSRGRRALDGVLYDYPSARFTGVRAKYTVGTNGARHYFICGRVDAKNRLGAYTGWTGFALADLDGVVNVFLESDGLRALLYEEVCQQSDGVWDTFDYSSHLQTGR